MTDHRLQADEDFPEVSIVIPCLNEADTLATCIAVAARALREHRIAGEIIVADNGSTDGSQDLAAKLSARLVNVRERGYGSALMGASTRPGESLSSWATQTLVTLFGNSKSVEKLRQDSISSRDAGCPRAGTNRRGRHAVAPPDVGQPDVLFPRPLVVSRAAPRRLLRHARFSERHLLYTRSTLYRDGVRHGDDHQGESLQS
jgi:glycosyltransferase involved in cell wall biosynthesis